MEQITVKIKNRIIPLRFKMPEVEIVEEEIGNLMDTSRLFLKGKGRGKNLIKAIRIMGNAALEKEGKEPDLTDEWLTENMNPLHTLMYQTAVIQAISQESRSEAEIEREETEERDLVLEEIQKKKEPVNSHTEESSTGDSSPD